MLELCVLALLSRKDCYGFELVSTLSLRIGMSEGTVYPLLKRLKDDGRLTTYLVESNEGPPRKYYRVSAKGCEGYAELRGQWRVFAAQVESIISDGGTGEDGANKSGEDGARQDERVSKVGEERVGGTGEDGVNEMGEDGANEMGEDGVNATGEDGARQDERVSKVGEDGAGKTGEDGVNATGEDGAGKTGDDGFSRKGDDVSDASRV